MPATPPPGVDHPAIRAADDGSIANDADGVETEGVSTSPGREPRNVSFVATVEYEQASAAPAPLTRRWTASDLATRAGLVLPAGPYKIIAQTPTTRSTCLVCDFLLEPPYQQQQHQAMTCSFNVEGI